MSKRNVNVVRDESIGTYDLKLQDTDILKMHFQDGKVMGCEETPEVAKTLAHVDIRATSVKRLMDEWFRDTVLNRLDDIDLETIIEMHSEKRIVQHLDTLLENGFSGGPSLEKLIVSKVKELAAAKIAAEYQVTVQVTLTRKGGA